MMPVKRLLKIFMPITCILAALTAAAPVFAAEPHEDPNTAPIIFNGTSLFEFYSSNLDFVLGRNQSSVQTDIQKSPFANISPTTLGSFNNFLTSSGSLCNEIIALDTGVNTVKELIQQSRYTEAAPLINQSFGNVTSGRTNLDTIEQATNIAALEFKIADAKTPIAMKSAYQAVLAKIQSLRDLLDLFKLLLAEQSDMLNQKQLLTTEVTLIIQPTEAFVGDTITVGGTLSSSGNPLGNRSVIIMLDSSEYLSLVTDASGHYFGSMQVPYWYKPVIQIQALFVPQGDDKRIYESALSPVLPLKVLYYDAALKITTETRAYPGKGTSITGRFSYGINPLPAKRQIEISLDNSVILQTDVYGDFTQILTIPPDMPAGNHLVTISVTAAGRYAPILASTVLNVTKSTPVLTLVTPGVVFIPGSFVIKGRLASETGPVVNADVIITFAGNQFNALTGNDGTFTAAVKSGMGFGLFGAQSLDFRIAPANPWENNLTTSHKLFTVFLVNCIAFFLIILVLIVILPRRIKFRKIQIRFSPKKKMTQYVVTSQSEPFSESFGLAPMTEIADGKDAKPETKGLPERLFFFYRIVIQLVQRVSGVLLKPNQTLREFARETSSATGAAGKPILEFTRMIEKVLYSPHKVTDEDIQNGQQLAKKVQESLKK